MTNKPPSSEDLLRLINDLGAEAAHTDDEARAELRNAGVTPGHFADEMRERLRLLTPAPLAPLGRMSVWDARLRTGSLVALAASAIIFVSAFTMNHRAEVAAERQLADSTAQLVRWQAAARAIDVQSARNPVYTARILAGLQKLQLSRDPDDRKVAIWNDLLPVLQEARKNRDDFLDVAVEYQRVLPLLRVGNPDVFLDSYWGELWILNILLDSRIVPVVEAARQQAPDPAVVDRIYQTHRATLTDRDRRAFEEAITVYRTTLARAR